MGARETVWIGVVRGCSGFGQFSRFFIATLPARPPVRYISSLPGHCARIALLEKGAVCSVVCALLSALLAGPKGPESHIVVTRNQKTMLPDSVSDSAQVVCGVDLVGETLILQVRDTDRSQGV